MSWFLGRCESVHVAPLPGGGGGGGVSSWDMQSQKQVARNSIVEMLWLRPAAPLFTSPHAWMTSLMAKQLAAGHEML